MGNLDAIALEKAGHESAGERIPCTDRVGDFHNRSRLVRSGSVFAENIGTIRATGEDKHLKTVILNDTAALILKIDQLQRGTTVVGRDASKTEELCYGRDFFIIELQDIALSERLFDDLA